MHGGLNSGKILHCILFPHNYYVLDSNTNNYGLYCVYLFNCNNACITDMHCFITTPFITVGCNCNINSSTSIFCDPQDGACSCMPNVVGRDCSSCAENHWGLGSDSGCVECQCNATGSETLQCDVGTGSCSCRPGVTGERCNACMEGHYGFSEQGCRYE